VNLGRTAIVLGCAAMLCLSGCATVQGPNGQSSSNDPLEPINKPIFNANLWLFRNVLGPVNQGYEAVTPKFFRTSVSNVFANADMPYVFVNDFLQGRVQLGMSGLSRFLVNTIFGLGGIFDVANKLDLPKQSNNFGVTLGVWGVPQGPYLVLPFYGPSSLRNLPGLALAIYTAPPYYFPSSNAQWAWSGMGIINTGHVDAPQVRMVEDAVNPYVFARNAWEQHEQFLIDGGKVNKSQLLEGLDLPPATATTDSAAATP